MDKRGKFIVFEGGEGSGKSTQIERLKNSIGSNFPEREFIFTKEPGGTPFANEVRALMISDAAKHVSGRTMLNLVMTSRSDHVENLIIPALAAGKIVVCDRYLPSSYAYQIVAQQSPELDSIFWAFADLLPQPDHHILLEIDPDVAQERVTKRDSGSHFHNRDLNFHTRVREGYREYFKRSGHVPSIIDANQDIETVWREVQNSLQLFLE